MALLALLVTAALGVAVAGPAVDGEGIMTVSPTSATYGSSSNTFIFTFTANIGDFGAGSQVALTIPAGWTTPTAAAGPGRVTVDSGTATLSGSPPFAVTGSTITIDMASCPAGHYFAVTYSGVTAPAPSGSPYTFLTQTDIGAGGSGLVDTTAPAPTVAIDPATLTVSTAGLTPDNKIYDGTTTATIVVGAPTLVGIINSDSVSLVTGGVAGTFDDKNVGTAKAVAIAGLTLTGTNAGNYLLTQPTRTADITERPISVTAEADSKTYDGTNSSAGVPTLSAATPLSPGDLAPAWTQTFGDRNVGTGKILTPAGQVIDGNNGLNYAYTFIPNTGGVITPRAITVTASTDSKTYDGTTSSSQLPTLSGTTPLAPGDIAPAWTQTFDDRNVGTNKTLTPAGKVLDGNNGLNYTYTFNPATTGIITPAPLTITANHQTKTYGAADPVLTYIASGFQLGDTQASVLTGALTRAAGEAVSGSPYAITQGTLAPNSNYTIGFTSSSLTITPTSLLVTAQDATREYGQTNPVFSATYSGFVTGETNTVLGGILVLATVADTNSPVGTYPIAGAGLTSTDYSITYSNGTLTVLPHALTVTAQDKTVVYGAADPEFTATYSGFVNGETSAVLGGTLSFSRPPGETVGTYPITASGLSSTNYSIVFLNGTLTISQAELTITADAREKSYGQTITFAGTEFTSGGLVHADTVGSVTLTSGGAAATAVVASSPFSIVPSDAVGTGLTNYSIRYINGVLTVKPAPLTITANNYVKDYGQTAIFTGIEFTAIGLVNADVVSSVTLTSSGAAATAPVIGSPYSIVPAAAVGTGLGNYAISYVDGILTANPVPMTITANNYTKTFGQTVTFAGTEFSATGLVNGETVGSVTLASAGATPTATPGTYDITPSEATGGSFLPGNYQIEYRNGTLTVNPQPSLLFSVQEGLLVLSWSTNASGFKLETSTNLSDPGTWVQVADPVHVVGAQNVVTNSMSGRTAFFRLKL